MLVWGYKEALRMVKHTSELDKYGRLFFPKVCKKSRIKDDAACAFISFDDNQVEIEQEIAKSQRQAGERVALVVITCLHLPARGN